MNKRNLLVLILLINILVLHAQVNRIIGTVTDVQTGETLVGANVVVLNTAYGAATDLEGKFTITNIPIGKYTLRISYIGYEQKEISIKVFPNKVLNVDIKLQYSGSINLEEVQVTAQAKGQLQAINEQLSSKNIKNVVSKDRIQELPDANAAESVGRLPGVSIQRVGGEANKVVIRGLSPKYNKVMIDGIEISSTDGGDRSVDMSMISPYSLDGIELLKAITPDQDGNFIGGSINFKLHQAEKGFHTTLIAQGGYNGLKESYNNYNFVGSISNRFFNDRFGAFLQMNLERRDRSSNDMNGSYYMTEQNQDKLDPVYTAGVGLTDVIRERQRYGATLVFDYKISTGKLALKNFISVGKTKSQFYSDYYSSQGRSFSSTTTDNENNLIIYNNVLEYEQSFNNFNIDAKVAHSYSENETPYNVSFNFNQTSALEQAPNNVYPSEIPKYATRIDYNKLYFWNVGDAKDINKGRQFAAMANMEWTFKLSNQINGSIKFGSKFRFIDRSYDYESTGGIMGLSSGRQVKDAILEELGKIDDIGNMSLLPFAYFMNNEFNHHEFLKGEYKLGPVVDTEIMKRIINIMRSTDVKTLDTYSYQQMNSLTNDYSGKENMIAGYFMSTLNLTNNLEIIPGIRYENNVTEYTGVQGNSSGAYPQQNYPHEDSTTIRKNGLWLPMVHLRYKPFPWLLIHFAYTNSLARPDFNIIIPRQDIGQKLIVKNNFNILPEKSENFDLYFTFHQNYIGLFSIGGFSKNITDKIFWMDQRALLNPTDYNLPDSYKGRLIITQDNFKETAKLWGIEFDWQTNFWYLPGVLKGLVFNVNFTHIESKMKYPRTTVESKYKYDENFNLILIQKNIDTTYTDRMIDQPNNIINLSLGYDYKDFSARLSMLYQSDIFSQTNFNPEMRIYTDDYLRWDFSVKQNLPWQGIQVYCNINNINQAVDILLNARTKYPTSMQHYGRTVDLGLRMKL